MKEIDVKIYVGGDAELKINEEENDIKMKTSTAKITMAKLSAINPINCRCFASQSIIN